MLVEKQVAFHQNGGNAGLSDPQNHLWNFCLAMSVKYLKGKGEINSVQFNHSVVSNSLQSHGPQHTRPPCQSRTPRVYSNSCPLSWWCHPNISSSVVPFSSCLQSFPPSGSFQISQSSHQVAQSIGVSVSASVFPMNIRDCVPLGLTGWTSLESTGLSRVFSNTTV